MHPSLSTNQAELLPYLKNICVLPNYSFKTCRVFIAQAMTFAGPATEVSRVAATGPASMPPGFGSKLLPGQGWKRALEMSF